MILPSLFILCVLTQNNDTLSRLNDQNKQILTMSCQVLNYGSKSDNGPVARSSGELYFQKPKYFRMISYGDRLDKRLMLDIGSNEDIFWFFARRIKPVSLKYAKYNELDKTRLDGTLNPIWMMEILGLNTINIENAAKIIETDKQISVYYISRAPNGEKNTKIIIVNKKLLMIVGHFIYGTNDELISQVVVTNSTKISTMNIPSQLNIIWHKKDIDITIIFSDIKINKRVDSKFWQLPNIRPMENLVK